MKRNPDFEKINETLLPYKHHQLQYNVIYSVTKLKKKSLICLLSIWTISQPKHRFYFILVTLYRPK
jgi:hypothetical protein